LGGFRVFTKHFYDSMDQLNVMRPDVVCKATDHVKDQIDLIEKIIGNGYGYDTPEAVYFNVAEFPNYGEIFGQKISEKIVAVREEVKKGNYKKNPQDFALWIKTVGEYENHSMRWESPWGVGFPGWHIECSAMSMKYLGEQFDIHTGGEDHLPIHHPNEIAQSEAATGKHPFVKYWIHHAFLMVEGRKMSKSLGNLFTLEDVAKKGFDPISLRYLFLTAHYRDPLNFSWESLKSSQTALNSIRKYVLAFKSGRSELSPEKEEKIESFRQEFVDSLNDDLNTPKAVSVMWRVIKSNIPNADKLDLVLFFDEVFGLGLRELEEKRLVIPKEVMDLLNQREEFRKKGEFSEADKIRKKILERGFKILDTNRGARVERID
jgi:cysteinyl-tRNA synthetase